MAAPTAMLSGGASAKEKPPVFVESAAVKGPRDDRARSRQTYVMVRSDAAIGLYLMKLPIHEYQATYDRLRAAAFDEARAKYDRKLKTYRLALMDDGTGFPRRERLEAPIDPTEQNFDVTPFPMMASVAIGPNDRLDKRDDAPLYLEAVTPGSYRIYGPIIAAPNGNVTGTCFCMGSVRFEAKAGQIVDLGLAATQGLMAKPADGDSIGLVYVPGRPFFQPEPANAITDPRLKNYPILSASFHSIGKLPNYFGLTISRIPAMPGVMRYDRDRILDLTTPD